MIITLERPPIWTPDRSILRPRWRSSILPLNMATIGKGQQKANGKGCQHTSGKAISYATGDESCGCGPSYIIPRSCDTGLDAEDFVIAVPGSGAPFVGPDFSCWYVVPGMPTLSSIPEGYTEFEPDYEDESCDGNCFVCGCGTPPGDTITAALTAVDWSTRNDPCDAITNQSCIHTGDSSGLFTLTRRTNGTGIPSAFSPGALEYPCVYYVGPIGTVNIKRYTGFPACATLAEDSTSNVGVMVYRLSGTWSIAVRAYDYSGSCVFLFNAALTSPDCVTNSTGSMQGGSSFEIDWRP